MSATRRLVVSIDDQTLRVIEGGVCLRDFQVSTAIKGMGCKKDSYRTPIGNFRISEKIGAGHPSGTIFKARVPIGQWRAGESPAADLVLTRILRLDGLDSANSNTLERCVYIHGTNREDLIGQPSGHGCVRLRNDDMIELFDMVEENDLLEILPATRRRGKLLFVCFESVLVTLNAIGEMAHHRGEEVWRTVLAISADLRVGNLSQAEAFVRAMEVIRPERLLCQHVAGRCVAKLPAGTADVIAALKGRGWLPVVLATSPEPVVAPVARSLGIDHFEAPVLDFHEDGSFAGAARGYPVPGGFQQDLVIRDWLEAFLPERAVLIDHHEEGLGMNPPTDLMTHHGLDLLETAYGNAGLLQIFDQS